MIPINVYDLVLLSLAKVNRKGDRFEVNRCLRTCPPLVDELLTLDLIRVGTTNAQAVKAGHAESFFLTTKGCERLWTLGFCYRGTSSPQWRKRRYCKCGWAEAFARNFGMSETKVKKLLTDNPCRCEVDTQWNMVSIERKFMRKQSERARSTIANQQHWDAVGQDEHN